MEQNPDDSTIPDPHPTLNFPLSKPPNQPSIPSAPPTSYNYKNRLQEYTQRSSISLPEYRTVQEGPPHAPKFRSSVTVDGITYTSTNTFSHRKAAEQDVAKLSMECISKNAKQESYPFIGTDTVFCKSILNEFVAKMKLPKLIYNTVQPEEGVAIFVSSVVFNGTTYKGDPGKSKKEAEQLVARAVILSLMGESGFGTLLLEIMKSKGKLIDALQKAKDLHASHGILADGENSGSDCAIQEGSVPEMHQQIVVIPEVYMTGHPQRHEFRVPKQETSSAAINPPAEFAPPDQHHFITFVPPAQEQVTGVSPSLLQKRHRKNTDGDTKKARVGMQ